MLIPGEVSTPSPKSPCGRPAIRPTSRRMRGPSIGAPPPPPPGGGGGGGGGCAAAVSGSETAKSEPRAKSLRMSRTISHACAESSPRSGNPGEISVRGELAHPDVMNVATTRRREQQVSTVRRELRRHVVAEVVRQLDHARAVELDHPDVAVLRLRVRDEHEALTRRVPHGHLVAVAAEAELVRDL